MFFKEDKLTAKKLIGVFLGFAGIIAINANSVGISFNVGDALIIAASFCTVFSNVISKKVFRTIKPITSTGISQLFGGVVLLIIGNLLGGKMHFAFDNSAFIMIYICFVSILSYCIWFSVVKNGELSKLFIIKFAEPMFACIFGALILGEVLNAREIVGCVLMISAFIIANTKVEQRF